MSVLKIVSLRPDACNANGDAENARVLSQRARWSGHQSIVIEIMHGDPTPSAIPDLVVIGSMADSRLVELRDDLKRHAVALGEWISAGVPVLAVGTGWELLGGSIPTKRGLIEGLHAFPGRATLSETRAAGDLVVESEFGTIVGFENHARGYELGASVKPLGSVLRGRGNSSTDAGRVGKVEGIRVGNSIGTHIHGPVLAKNPAIADFMLSSALPERYEPNRSIAGRLDEWASEAREQTMKNHGL